MRKPELGKQYKNVGTCYSFPETTLGALIEVVKQRTGLDLVRGGEKPWGSHGWYTLWIRGEPDAEELMRVEDILAAFTARHRCDLGWKKFSETREKRREKQRQSGPRLSMLQTQ